MIVYDSFESYARLFLKHYDSLNIINNNIIDNNIVAMTVYYTS